MGIGGVQLSNGIASLHIGRGCDRASVYDHNIGSRRF
jgi:hypothetical protein